MNKWWWGLPVVAVTALAVTVGWTVQTGHWPFGPGQDVRAPDQARQPDGAGAPGEPVRSVQESFVFKAARDGQRITLSGVVPRDETRTALLEEIKQTVADAEVTDETKTSDKARAATEEAAIFGLKQLARLPLGTVTIGDDAIAVLGTAPDFDAYHEITGARQSPPSGFRLNLAGLIPPAVRPFTWSVTNGEGEVVLAGHVPSDAAREALRAVAHDVFPDKQVVETLQVASGVPPAVDFDATSRFALRELAQLRTGAVDLDDATLNVTGDVTDRETLASVRAALQDGLPLGVKAGSVAITLSRPNPYTFRARREAGALILTGYYPDAETRTAIHQLILARFFGEQVMDKLRAADGAPSNYLPGVKFGLEHLARLASGEVDVRGTSLRLTGEALYEQSAEQIGRAVAAISVRGWTGEAAVRLRPSEKADAAQLRSPQP